MKLSLRLVLTSSFMLALFAMVGSGLVSSIYELTAPRIFANEEAAKLRSLGEVLDTSLYDNDLLQDTVQVRDATLDRKKPVVVHLARRQGEPVAAVFEATAPDGYSGTIRVLIAIEVNGAISGVRIVSHKETPGLGDPIDQNHGDWIFGFSGKSLQNPTLDGWRVKKDGGDFDQFTGATVSPRAVVGVVRRTLQYFQTHRDELFAGTGNAT